MMVVSKAREDASEQVDALKFMACAKIFVMAVKKSKRFSVNSGAPTHGVLNLDRFRWAPTQKALKSIACVNIFIMAVDNANDSQSLLALRFKTPALERRCSLRIICIVNSHDEDLDRRNDLESFLGGSPSEPIEVQDPCVGAPPLTEIHLRCPQP